MEISDKIIKHSHSSLVYHHYVDNFKEHIFNILKMYDSIEVNLLISGGSICKLLNNSDFLLLNTAKWNIYYSDERIDLENKLLPSDSNFLNSRKFIVNTEATVVRLSNDNLEKYKEVIIDICILGIGEDGHIASIFPHSFLMKQYLAKDIMIVENNKKDNCCDKYDNVKCNNFLGINHEVYNKSFGMVALINDSPKLPPMRLTVTIEFLKKCKKICFFMNQFEKQGITEPHNDILKLLNKKIDVHLLKNNK